MKKSAKKSVGWAKKGKITEKLQKNCGGGTLYFSICNNFSKFVPPYDIILRIISR